MPSLIVVPLVIKNTLKLINYPLNRVLNKANHTCPPPGKITTPVPCLRSLKCLLSFLLLPESEGDFLKGFSFSTPSTALLRAGSLALAAAVWLRPDTLHSGLVAPADAPKAGLKLVAPTLRYCVLVDRNPLAILTFKLNPLQTQPLRR